MSDDSFASRWSRRKQAVKDEALEVAPEPEVEELPEEPEKSDTEILEEFNLKDPDEMEAGDDFSAFMNSAIPERLRNRALRKLWLSNPVLANLDELLDYGEDFTNKGAAVEEIVTAYKVGKGFVDKLVGDDEKEIDLADIPAEDDSSDSDETVETGTSAPASNVRIPDEVRTKTPQPTESKPIVTTDALPETPRKRMRFKF